MRSVLRVLFPALLATAGLRADGNAFESFEAGLIERYRLATEAQRQQMRGVSMEVDIQAALPKLKKQGRLHALRHISTIGKITYNLVKFDGDNTVKKEVIARYLSAETQDQGMKSPPITPEHYKFKYKGMVERSGHIVHVFQLTPNRKAAGLFKGELWLDPTTCLPVRETGRMVKNPSVFVKRFEFTRDFEIREGLAVPLQTKGVVETRMWGKAELSIAYNNFVRQETAEAGPFVPTRESQ